MPFDAREEVPQASSRRVSKASRPIRPGHRRLMELSGLLRSPDSWPENFEWDFSDIEDVYEATTRRYGFLGLWRETKCYTAGCALGLHRLVSPYVRSRTTTDTGPEQAINIAKVYDMPVKKAAAIFHTRDDGRSLYSVSVEYITPEMVAAEIDKYLASVYS